MSVWLGVCVRLMRVRVLCVREGGEAMERDGGRASGRARSRCGLANASCCKDKGRGNGDRYAKTEHTREG